ncbi:FAD-binding oxidoreductase [Nakamurella endophytica]|uniref:FAD-linked oxidase n=1 Tax=Nakamurella endophytica TaxID=1748367 RepID=A0A917TD51_9ACTN|nr:FAD-binding protein [Nakamurella endophytica]GGM19192.1 FAD-linked oxidase [Nakamurella endophytica]
MDPVLTAPSPARITPPAVRALRSAVAGPVLVPDDPDYTAEVAGFDLAVRHRPDAAVGAASGADVVATLQLATAHGLPVAVVGTGHADIPELDGGVLLTTRRLAGVTVDAEQRTARVGAGTRWREVVAAADAVGLAAICGSAPDVGAVGLLLGGGHGPVGRTYGICSDRVRSLEVVLPQARAPLTVTADAEPDLFFALRGGKHDLGVVTAVTVGLVERPEMQAGGWYFDAADIPQVLATYRTWVTSGTVPDTVTTSVALLRPPDLPTVPEPLRGRSVVHLRAAVVGTPQQADELLAPLRSAGTPVAGGFGPLPYGRIGEIHRDPVLPSAHAGGGLLLDDLTEDTVAALLDRAGPAVRAPLGIVEIRHLGGAFAVPVDDAVAGRDAAFGVWASSRPIPDGPDGRTDGPARTAAAAAVRAVLDGLLPWSSGAAQVNFSGMVNTPQEVERGWPAETLRRLREVRRARGLGDADGEPRGAWSATPEPVRGRG